LITSSEKKRYLAVFSGYNLLFLAVMLLAAPFVPYL
jgi:hypothetical protein